MRRIFSTKKITRILGSQIHDADRDISIDLGNGLRAVMSASVYKALKAGERPDYKFFLETDGKEQRELEKATEEELAKISEFLWKNVAPQFLNSHEILDLEFTPDALLDNEREDVLDPMTPDELREKPDMAEGLDALVPDALREKPDDPNLEDDPLGLTPDSLRAIIADPELARRLATGTATPAENLESLLMPESLKGGE
jgi:hypothetical protein